MQLNFLDPQNELTRIYNSVGKICLSSTDYATFVDKTTSFPKRYGLNRNTSSISHTVVAEKKTSMVFQSRRSGKQEEEKLHDYYVNHDI